MLGGEPSGLVPTDPISTSRDHADVVSAWHSRVRTRLEGRGQTPSDMSQRSVGVVQRIYREAADVDSSGSQWLDEQPVASSFLARA